MRLIDADAFERRCMFDSNIEDMQDVIYALRDYSTVPAIPISVMEQIKAEIGSEMNVTRDQYSIRQNDYCDGFVFAMKQVLEIIDYHIKEYTE